MRKEINEMGRYFAYVFGVILVSLVLYLTYDNHRLQGIVTEYSQQAIKAAAKRQKEQLAQQQEIANAEKRAINAEKSESDRFRRLAATVDIDSCINNPAVTDTVLRLHNSAAADKYLPEASYTREIGQGTNTTTVLLDNAEERNQIAREYNDLYRLIKQSECF